MAKMSPFTTLAFRFFFIVLVLCSILLLYDPHAASSTSSSLDDGSGVSSSERTTSQTTTVQRVLTEPNAARSESQQANIQVPQDSTLSSSSLSWIVWRGETCFPQSELLQSARIIEVAAAHCPTLLPSEILARYREDETNHSTTTPSLSPSPLPPSTGRQLLGMVGVKKFRSGGKKGKREPMSPEAQRELQTAFNAAFATPVCGTLNYTTCGFIRRGRFFPVKVHDEPPFPAPVNVSSSAGTKGREIVLGTRTAVGLQKIMSQDDFGDRSGFSGGSCKQNREAGLLNQRIQVGEGVAKEFSLTRRTSTSAADKTNQTAMNTIQWVHWEQPKRNVNTTCSSSLPPLSPRPQPSAYRNSLEILQTIRSFHKARLAAEQRTCSSALTSPPKILFSGDSMMRHLFLRLAFLLRGEEVIPHDHPRRCAQNGGPEKPVMEHYLHGDVVYRLYDDGVDEFEVVCSMQQSNLAEDPLWRLNGFDTVEDYMAKRNSSVLSDEMVNSPFSGWKDKANQAHHAAGKDQVVLELHFLWDLRHVVDQNRVLSTKFRCVGAGYSLHVHAANYFNDQPDIGVSTPFVEGLMGSTTAVPATMNISREKCGCNGVTILATEPPNNNDRAAELNKQVIELGEKLEIQRKSEEAQRHQSGADNHDTETTTKSVLGEKKYRNKHIYSFDLAGISKIFLDAFVTKPNDLRCDEVHFMCTFFPRLPEPIVSPKPVYCPGNPCRDDVNAALVQILVDHLPLFSF